MRTAPLLAAAAATLLLAGCGTASAGHGGIYADPVEPTSSRPAPQAAAGDQDAAQTQGQTQGKGDLGTCMVGDWDVPNSTVMMGIKAAMLANPQSADLSPRVDIDGGQWARFDSSTLTTTFENMVMHITMTNQGHQIEEFATLTGSTVQSYSLAGDVMTTGATNIDGLAVSMTFQLDGQPFAYPGSDDPAAQMREMLRTSGGSARVTCDATTLRQVPIVDGQDAAPLSADLTRR